MKISQDMLMQQIAELPEAVEIMEKYMPGRFAFLSTSPQTRHLSLRQVIKYSKGTIPAQLGDAIEKELVARLGTQTITPLEKKKIETYQRIARQPSARYEEPFRRSSFMMDAAERAS